MQVAWRSWFALCALVTMAACRSTTSEAPIAPSTAVAPVVDAPAPEGPNGPRIAPGQRVDGAAVPGAQVVIGAPIVVQNLTVFPVLSTMVVDLGPITTLDAAIREGKAEVRELGAVPAPAIQETGSFRNEQPQQAIQQIGGGGASVNTLVIENKGKTAIYVLAGTIVKGGKQDRQIGQDFVVEPLATVPVDAFCVEHGRWTEVRDGQATAGKFSASGKLAVGEVRAAAQYASNQSEVWEKVEEVNKKHGKEAATGTLLVTLDDATVQKQVDTLAAAAKSGLAGVEPQAQVVGFAYAIDGKVRGVRWFADRRVYELFRDPLIDAAALDALTEQAGQPPKAPPALAAADVVARMQAVEAAPEEERATEAGNVNAYKKSEAGYGSKVKRAAKPGQVDAAQPYSTDYMMH